MHSSFVAWGMLELGTKVLLGYLLGSLNGSLFLGRILGGPDIRTVGSGNAGGTNALRARGKWFALGVMVIDVGKGYIAAALLPGVDLGLGAPGIAVHWLPLACGAAAVVGHCYPIWFDFAGGKGAATAVGTLGALAPGLLLPALAVWLLVATTTGFVGLSTMAAALVLPAYVALVAWPAEVPLLVFLVLLAGFIIYTHRGNVVRMLRRQENRMTGLMLLRRPR
ncbi:glycerol-3-phosphate acyltransferase PlsY [Gammaproteobacteria bacterium]|nr:glycerol-3-phosphate 1-O-acyltransferase PlsY [Gammaproteobacteria bacterium]CAG0942406.1 glycerol-3-phosphate acyltransferase PlsY [Gammaproteobacteria bacterium]